MTGVKQAVRSGFSSAGPKFASEHVRAAPKTGLALTGQNQTGSSLSLCGADRDTGLERPTVGFW